MECNSIANCRISTLISRRFISWNVHQVELLIIHRVLDLEVSYRSDEVWMNTSMTKDCQSIGTLVVLIL